ncbi:NIPSNAP family protein [Tunicatimonas pelagia]|uniref:NIPSNAP family protein n=1 Tax=Tunicatimonas pelagia TaxID=931531 RepID=UPI002665CC75|nr:NIPSNAP family protein [Tunicatimonas pelagia]WKN41629.1 NIPSNAP family protein [Tunicatimonas pelagia]
MNRRNFLQQSTMAAASLNVMAQPVAADQQYYEWRTYELKSGTKMKVFDEYLQLAFIPAMNALGIENIGVFMEMGMPEPPRLHLLLTFSSLEEFAQRTPKMLGQATYQQNSQSFAESASPANPNFTRYENSLMRAFEAIPQMEVPEADERIFELRTYEGYNDDAVRRKIAMFNDDELPLFYETGLHPVFFGETLIGEKLPQLTYMLTFKDMEERDANWKKFINHPEWKRMSSLPKYANSVSRVNRIFLKPTAYSQV